MITGSLENTVDGDLNPFYCTEIISPPLEEVCKGLLEAVPISKIDESLTQKQIKHVIGQSVRVCSITQIAFFTGHEESSDAAEGIFRQKQQKGSGKTTPDGWRKIQMTRQNDFNMRQQRLATGCVPQGYTYIFQFQSGSFEKFCV